MSIDRHSTEWYEALDAFVRDHRDQPFAWGSHDCCTFAADWVLRVRGVDPMDGLRGQDTALKAERKLAALGGLVAAWDARFGPHVAGAFAQAGDLTMVRLDNGDRVMGVCLGALVAVPATDGLLNIASDRIEATWRV